jgi:hypothetical protein
VWAGMGAVTLAIVIGFLLVTRRSSQKVIPSS